MYEYCGELPCRDRTYGAYPQSAQRQPVGEKTFLLMGMIMPVTMNFILDLAERIGVEPETISRFKRGATTPSLQTLEKISHCLRVRIGELLAETSAQPDDQTTVHVNYTEACEKGSGACPGPWPQASCRRECHQLKLMTLRNSPCLPALAHTGRLALASRVRMRLAFFAMPR